MAAQNPSINAFNRGIISPLALARTDIDRTALSAETMTNWMPSVMGSMMLRTGLQYLASTKDDNAARFIPFVFSTDDTALIELTSSFMRVWVDDAVISRPSVSTSITNGGFNQNLNNWTDNDEAGATSSHDVEFDNGATYRGNMKLLGDGSAYAIRTQQVTVAGGDQNVEHALNISIGRPRYDTSFPYAQYPSVMPGAVQLKVGSSDGNDDYIPATFLEEGEHSLSFTPTGGTFWVEFSSKAKYPVYVSSCDIASSGAMEVATSITGLDSVRYDQSGDIIFVAHKGSKANIYSRQQKIERRGTRSWSVVNYYSFDGPFGFENTTSTTMTPSALTGEITLTASDDSFTDESIGSLFRLTSEGQTVTAAIAAQNTWTNEIKVTGAAGERIFTVTISGTWSGTVRLQKSLDPDSGSWTNVNSWTANTTEEDYDDGLDNQIIYYRIGIDTGEYTSGTATVTLSYAGGSITGVCMLTTVNYTGGIFPTTSYTATVLKDLGSTDATKLWAEGKWSEKNGWPSSVAFAEGRLWWAGSNGVWGSISDDYYSFDPDYEGDAGPIDRTIGSGPVDTINFLLPLQRLTLGAEGAEFVCKASGFDEPLTPTDFSIRPVSDQGSNGVSPARIDKMGVFVQRGGTRLFRLAYDSADSEYGSDDLTIAAPNVTSGKIVRMAVQRQPDTRIHCVLANGDVAVLVFDRLENVTSWQTMQTDGSVEDVVVLPGTDGEPEDQVYYVVNRTINSSTVRYLEKWAQEDECEGGTTNKQADSFLVYSGSSTTAMTGLSHLEGETVVVWGGGKDLGTYTVSSGAITLTEAVTDAVIGLGYTAQWKSSKLAYGARYGTALTQKKRINHLGVIALNTHYQGLKFGPDFSSLDDLPQMDGAGTIADDTVHTHFDMEAVAFPGKWDTDSRLCLQAAAPRPCNLLAAIISVETNEKR